jgi:hypothetical protein
MDALSSQSNVAGYKAALLGAENMGRFYPMLMTAAGTIPPAKVLVLGVGVAGLQALATAKRLGARTTGYDVRPEVAEQVQSLGAQWLDLGLEASGEGGYARELSDEERARQQQALTDAIKGFDVVITTALVPGRPAPKLVTAEAVEGMKPGSVIIDLAGEAGGNCELTEPGETVVKHDVKIVSPLNLPASMAEHSSQLFARNVQALLDLLVVPKEGADGVLELKLDFEDEIVAGACTVREGEIVNAGAKAAVEAAGSGAAGRAPPPAASTAAFAPAFTISPSRTVQAPATISSSKSSFSSSSAWTLRANSCEACSGMVAGRFSGDMIFTSWRITTSPGSVSSQLPPASPARSTITDPGFMPCTAASVTSLGAGRPGTRAVVITTSKPLIASVSACCWRARSSSVSSRA